MGSTASAEENERRELWRQLAALEKSPVSRGRQLVAGLLGLVGLLAIVGPGLHGRTAYGNIATIDASAGIHTPSPLVLFQDVATNGPHVGAAVETGSRAGYTRALEQLVIDGTGVAVGIVLLVGALMVRKNL